MPLKDKEARRAKHTIYMREVWYPRNRSKHVGMVVANKRSKNDRISEIKMARGCADCGYKEHSVALDFDHLKDKDFNISNSATLGKSWKLIELEIAKCEVVCANCHRVRTAARLIK